MTAELVKEYGEGLKQGVEAGVLPDLGKAAGGATRKLGGLQSALRSALRSAEKLASSMSSAGGH